MREYSRGNIASEFAYCIIDSLIKLIKLVYFRLRDYWLGIT